MTKNRQFYGIYFAKNLRTSNIFVTHSGAGGTKLLMNQKIQGGSK
jgi:hypothetical protein